MFFSLVACGLFAYTMNIIGSIFSEQAQQDAHYKRQRSDLYEFMRSRNIHDKLQVRALQYLEYVQQIDREGMEKSRQTLSLMSQEIQNKILKDYYGKQILLKHKYFNLVYSREALIQSSLRMRELIFAPGESIIRSRE